MNCVTCGKPEYLEYTNDLEKIKEVFLDMLNQSCAEWDPNWDSEKKCYRGEAIFKGYDSMCISAYENALDLAAELGWIKREEITR